MGIDPNLFEIINNEQINLIKKNQAETLNLVNDERKRLMLKKSNMDADADNAERMLLLNQSYRDRQYQYLVIMVLFLIVFGICLAIVVLQNKFGYSSIFMDVLIVVVIGSGMVTAFFMISNIFIRDKIAFDKLGQDGGNLIDLTKLSASTNAGINGSGTTSVCKGAACCDTTNTVWDPTTQRCK